MDSQYEKLDAPNPDETQRKGRKITSSAILSLLLGAVLSLLIIFKFSDSASSPYLAPLVKDGKDEVFSEKRASGTEYLLGVGKADITG